MVKILKYVDFKNEKLKRLLKILCFWTLSIVLSLSKNTVLFIFKNNVSETKFCLLLQVKSAQLGPVDRVSPYLPENGDRIQCPKRCVLKYKQDDVLDENRTMDNVQKYNICTNVPSSQTFRSQ
jgi:hypothetical protein